MANFQLGNTTGGAPAATTAGTGFSFGGAATGTPNTSFSFGQTANPAAAQATNMTKPNTNVSSGTQWSAGFSFNTSAPQAANPTTLTAPAVTATVNPQLTTATAAGGTTGGFSFGALAVGGGTSLGQPKTVAQVTPQVAPQFTPQATPQFTPQATPQFTPQATPQFTPQATPQFTPQVTPQVPTAPGTATTTAKIQATGSLFGTATPGNTPSLNLAAAKPTAATPLTLSQAAAVAPQAGGLKIGDVGLGGLGSNVGLTKPISQVPTNVPQQVSDATSLGATLSTVTSTSASALVPTSLNYRQLEEAINKWTLELEEQEKIFLEQATQVNAWDRMLIDNGDKITELNTNVERVKLDQQHLDQELDFILSQQKELEELLIPLEQAVENLPAPLPHQQHADLERQHTYKLSENIDAQLKRMSQDLKEIIEHVNTSNTNQDNMDPVTQVAKILNAHMDSLHWVEQNAVLLQRRMEEVSRLGDLQRKEQERSYRLAYD